MLILVGLLATIVGISLGLLGGGGSILVVPLLKYVAGASAHEAVAASLLVVGTTAAFGAWQHARAGRIDWKAAAQFAPGTMLGAWAGGKAAGWIAGPVLLLLFAGMMAVASISMIRGKRAPASRGAARSGLRRASLIVAQGLGVGFFTGLVGAGGGFLIVPALVLLGGLGMHVAVGTSLAVIAVNSFAGFAGHASHTPIEWPLVAVVTLGSLAGTLVGTALVARVRAHHLQTAFGWFVLVMAAYIGWRESAPWLPVGARAVVVGGGVLALALLALRRPIVPSPPATAPH